MKRLPDGTLLLTERHEYAIFSAIEQMMGYRKDDGRFCDWEMKIKCTENGNKIKAEVCHLELFPALKVAR